MLMDEEEHLAHYGILRKSGRYPWGSGKDKEELGTTFNGSVDILKARGLTEVEIARGFGISTKQLRAAKSIEKNAQKQANINMAQRLKDKGWSNVAIGKRMGINESSVRDLLAPGKEDRVAILTATSDMLKEEVANKKFIDIGVGVEQHLGMSSTKLATAVAKLEEEGYAVHRIKVKQLGTGKDTTIKVLAAPGTTQREVYLNRDNIKQIPRFTEDGGRTFDLIMPPISVNTKRVGVRYAEQGGSDADGVIYVRPGIKDLSLGGSRYAQVRIAVGGTHYLKGMAVYKDDLPDGVDLLFNTNKSSTGNNLDAMKPMKKDPDYPFGASINRQIQEVGPDGKKRLTSAMNIVNEEGRWDEWSRTLSSQMLSKQSPMLARTQLDLTYKRKRAELDEILNTNNAAVKQKLLDAYADSADYDAVHLKAAALPRQSSHVILPVNSMKETEVYAPNFEDGKRVVLIRYPHGGIFEIPELIVNNRNPEAKKLLGRAPDAIGIHSKVAERLSGADFDGDSVLVIPNDKGLIKTAPPLEGLKGFDPQRAYPGYPGMAKMTPRQKGIEMGMISNLITDMTIRGAVDSEKARAVRHSMVVIDAEKHGLNYKQSAIDNGIAQLKEKYQGGKNAGARTLISRASAEIKVDDRKPRSAANGGPIDKETGRLVYEPTGASYLDRKTGRTVLRKVDSTKLAETDDAHTLSSGTLIESIYAEHSNKLKALANEARKASLGTGKIKYDPKAREAYPHEVQSLEAKLNLALRNSPRERQAQIIANAIVAQKKAANPDMDKEELKKLDSQELTRARIRTGAKKQRIEITAEEWTAIQAGAISTHKLHQILNHADLDKVKQLATPKTRSLMTNEQTSRAVQLLRKGYTQAEVAEHLGVTVSMLKKSLTQGGE